LDKSEIRSSYLQKRTDKAPEELRLLSIKVQEAFISSPEFRASGYLALYSGFRGEVSTDLIAEQARGEGKSLAYPKVMGHNPPHLAFFAVGSPGRLSPGAFGILEPDGEALARGELDLKAVDCIVVPGVAFDRYGTRLGYGKGFYDRRLAKASCDIVALAYGFQVMDAALPRQPHDEKMDMIVTEKEVLRF